jgi:hypothetical protein
MKLSRFIVAIGISFALAQVSVAQQFGNGGMGGGGGGFNSSGAGGTSGMFGGRNLGSTVGNRNSSFRGSSSGIGQTDIAGSGAGILNGNERFMRNSRNANSFVGGDSTENRGFVGSVGSGQGGSFGQGSSFGRGAGGTGGFGGQRGGQFGGLGGMNQFGGLNQLGRSGFGQYGQNGRGFNQFNQGQRGQNNMQNAPRVRTRTTLGFARPVRSGGAVVTQRVSDRVGRSVERLGGTDVAVQMEGPVAILRGTVPTSHARNLAEQLARLEPGIDQVQNELEVAGETAPGASLPESSQSQPSPPSVRQLAAPQSLGSPR